MLIVSWQRTARRNPQGDTSPSGEREERRERGEQGWGGGVGVLCCLTSPWANTVLQAARGSQQCCTAWNIYCLSHYPVFGVWCHTSLRLAERNKFHLNLMWFASINKYVLWMHRIYIYFFLAVNCATCRLAALFACHAGDVISSQGLKKWLGSFISIQLQGEVLLPLSHTLSILLTQSETAFFLDLISTSWLLSSPPSPRFFFKLHILKVTASPLPDPHFSPFPSSDHLSFPSYQIP